MGLIHDVRMQYPSLEHEEDSTIEYFLTRARGELSTSAWGSLYTDAVVSLAAHKMQKAKRDKNPSDTGAGPVILSQTGDHMKQFAQPGNRPGSNPDYQSTEAGKDLIILRRKRGSSGTVV